MEVRGRTGACASSLIPLLCATCTGPEESTWSELDPCGGSDHPCSMAGVSAEARLLTEVLSAEVLSRLGGPEGMADAVAWPK